VLYRRRANSEAHYALAEAAAQEEELADLAQTADVLEGEARVALEDRPPARRRTGNLSLPRLLPC
jgi:hypothetical protein